MDTVFTVLRVVVSLGAVFGALWWGHRWITKRGAGGARGKQIAVVARQALGAKAGVAIVDAHGRRYLLGVTEHTVTVLDTLGAAEQHDGVQFVSTAAVTLPGGAVADAGRRSQPAGSIDDFERELQTLTLSTGAIPVLVHGRADPGDPDGPITQVVAITRPDAPMSIESLAAQPYPTRRAAREAEQTLAAKPQPHPSGPLAGSVLSPQTWKQTVAALKQLR